MWGFHQCLQSFKPEPRNTTDGQTSDKLKTSESEGLAITELIDMTESRDEQNILNLVRSPEVSLLVSFFLYIII